MKKYLILLFALVFFYNTNAQKFKLSTVEGIFNDVSQGIEPDLAEAKKLIDEVKENPKTANDPKMWLYRGITYFEILKKDSVLAQQIPDALQIATEALFKCKETDTKNNNKALADLYLVNCGLQWFNKGGEFYSAKKYSDAIAAYNTVLKVIPYDDEENLKRNGVTEEVILLYSSYCASSMGDINTNRDLLEKLVQKNYNDPTIYLSLANNYLTQKDTAKAIETLSKGRTKFPANEDLMNMEINVYLQQGKTQVLIDKLNEAIEGSPDNKVYYFARGVSFEKMKDFKNAENDYKKAIEIDPEYYDAYFNLGVVQNNKAIPYIEKLTTKGNNLKAAEVKNYEEIIIIHTKEAITYFEKCLKLTENNTEINKLEVRELLLNIKNMYKRIDDDAKVAEYQKLIQDL